MNFEKYKNTKGQSTRIAGFVERPICFSNEIFAVWPFVLHQELKMTQADWPYYYFGIIDERKL